jgi:hypothetical protein
MELSYDEKRKLRDNLSKIEQHELMYIFNIIKKRNVKFTKNGSGIYIREDHLDQPTMREIFNFVEKKLEEHRLYRGSDDSL